MLLNAVEIKQRISNEVHKALAVAKAVTQAAQLKINIIVNLCMLSKTKQEI